VPDALRGCTQPAAAARPHTSLTAGAATPRQPDNSIANYSHLQRCPAPANCLHGGEGSRQSEVPTAVYVCLCNALTDHQVKQAATTVGTTRPSSVYAACGCRAQCGQCVKALLALLRGEDCAAPELLGSD
jgi:bacterioferritin-associated ferredoxin